MKCPRCFYDNPADTLYCGKCGTRLESKEQISFTRTLEIPTEGLTRGTLFANRYEIIEQLGEGGMGAVYRVEDTKVGEEVALKLIKSEVAAHKRTVERFRNELKVARQITHKHVCRMHDLNEEGKALFITMEYVRGEDLKSLIRRTKQLTVSTAVSITTQIAEGLSEAHRLGVIHRDLKPNNIMIDKEGHAKIMDFGIARSLAEVGTTVEGVIIGTPDYMSPEQAEGKSADQRSDIYSLGIILYEMLTGQVPFEGDTALSVAMKHKSEAPPDPRTLNSNIPVSLSRLILSCMEKDSSKRPQSAEEFRLELAKIQEALPAAESGRIPIKPTTPRTITIQLSGKRLLIPVGALVVIAAIIFGLLKFLPRGQVPTSLSPDGIPSVAVLYFKNNTGDQSLDIWRDGLCNSLIFQLSQSRFIRVLDQSHIFGILKKLNLHEQSNYTPEDLREIASLGQATHIVMGNFSQSNKTVRVEMILQDASTLEIIKPIMAEGTFADSFFTIVDDLASQLRSGFRLNTQQEAEDVFRDFGITTTDSIDAWSFFIQGWRLRIEGKDRESIPFFEKAISADPEFAYAYKLLSVAYGNLRYGKESKINLQKAFDLRDKVSERERLTIEAGYYGQTEKTWDKALETFLELIALYPWDLSGNADLAFLYFNMEEWDKSIEHYEILRRYKYDAVPVYLMLSRLYLSTGQTEKAAEVIEGYLANISDNGRIRHQLSVIHLIRRDFEKAEEEIQKAYARDPEVPKEAELILFWMTKDFDAADRLLEELRKSDRDRGYIGYQGLSYTLQGRLEEAKASFSGDFEKWLTSLDPTDLAWERIKEAAFLEKIGDFEEALAACNTGLSKAREADSGVDECQALFRRGVIQLKLGDLAGGETTAEELRQTIETGPVKKRVYYYDSLIGLLNASKNDTDLAVHYLENALPMTAVHYGDYNPRNEILYYLAEMFEKTGQWNRAIKAYEEILTLFNDYTFMGDALIWVKSHYKMAKALERMGDKKGAVQYYREFLEYWKNADPGLSEVADARERLAALRGFEPRSDG